MNSYKNLFNNSIIFAIGNLGSKLINFFLVPVYTYFLSPEEYGIVDLVVASVGMLLPLVSVSMHDAVMRFTMDQKKDNSEALTNSLIVAFMGILLMLFIYPILLYFNILEGYLDYTYVLLIFMIIERIFAQYARGSSNTKVFAISGVLLTLNTGVFNILFLVVFNLGIVGYFGALILSNVIVVIYLFFRLKLYNVINFKKIDMFLIKELVTYAVPLVPNAIMWQLINSSSKFFILNFNGVAANGLFAVSNKIPAMINLVTQVFSQAWQLSAIEEIDNIKNEKFYSNIFNILSTVLIFAIFFINLILRPLFYFIFEVEYYLAWQVVPFLLIGVMFSSFSSFFGGLYIASKKTKGVFNTSVIGGIISILLNWILIPYIGVMGAGISQMVSFLIMFFIRYLDTQKVISIKINWKNFIGGVFLIFCQIATLFIFEEYRYILVANIILFLFLLIINFIYLKQICLTALKIFKNSKFYWK